MSAKQWDSHAGVPTRWCRRLSFGGEGTGRVPAKIAIKAWRLEMFGLLQVRGSGETEELGEKLKSGAPIGSFEMGLWSPLAVHYMARLWPPNLNLATAAVRMTATKSFSSSSLAWLQAFKHSIVTLHNSRAAILLAFPIIPSLLSCIFRWHHRQRCR